MLLNEFLKEHRKVHEQGQKLHEQEARIAKQEAMIAQQQKQMEALNASLQQVSDRLDVERPAPQMVADNQ